MALDGVALTSAILNIFNGSTPTPSSAAAGTAWANAFDAYARTGEAGGVFPTVPPAATTALRAALGAQFAIVPGSPAGAASGIASALDAYWTQLVFPGQSVPPIPTGSGQLIFDLETIFAVVGGTHVSKADDLVASIATYTTNVFVEFPPGVLAPVG